MRVYLFKILIDMRLSRDRISKNIKNKESMTNIKMGGVFFMNELYVRIYNLEYEDHTEAEKRKRIKNGCINVDSFRLPIMCEEVEERLGIDLSSERYSISARYCLPFLYPETVTIEELNQLYYRYTEVADMPMGRVLYELENCFDMSLQELVENKDNIIYHNCSMEDFARNYMIESGKINEIPQEYHQCIDFKVIGEKLLIAGNYSETSIGIFEYRGK